MSTPRPAPPQETRAEVARRRLAQLTASFEATHPDDPFDRLVGGSAPVDHDEPSETTAAPRGGGRRRAAAPRRPRGLHGSHLRMATTAAVAAGVLLTWWLVAERPRTSDVDRPLQVSARADATGDTPAEGAASEASAEVVVDVAGKVRDPGIVTLPAGSRVFEAIEKAGGIEGTLEEPTINLARQLVDGEQILVGVEPADPAAAGATAGTGGTGGGVVDLNSATLEQLDALPGVGPVTAQSILDWRQENGRFTSVDDLLDVSGIGEKTLEDLRDRVTV